MRIEIFSVKKEFVKLKRFSKAFRKMCTKTAHHNDSFFPQAVTLMNSWRLNTQEQKTKPQKLSYRNYCCILTQSFSFSHVYLLIFLPYITFFYYLSFLVLRLFIPCWHKTPKPNSVYMHCAWPIKLILILLEIDCFSFSFDWDRKFEQMQS